jgi:hypothetical protein
MPIVQRTWGLLGGNDFYGANFYFSEFMKARNYLTGILFHFTLILGSVLLAIRPVRSLMKSYVYQPGDGPTEEVKMIELSTMFRPRSRRGRSARPATKAPYMLVSRFHPNDVPLLFSKSYWNIISSSCIVNSER